VFLASGDVWREEGQVNPQPAKPSRGVVLPPEHTGSSLFHAVLTDALAKFPDVLAAAGLPEQKALWKRDYGRLLARFEAHRVTSPRRVEIARYMQRSAQSALLYADAGATRPLAEYLSGAAEAPALQSIAGSGAPSLRAVVPLDGKLYRGLELLELVEMLTRTGDLTHAAAAALRWIVAHIEAHGGVLDLRGQRFALLGAGAELAATRMLLAAGATVLWVDVADPNAWLTQHGPFPGTLVYAPEASNLLEQPLAIRAAIERFASEGGPLHLGLFAYASGASQEWRLGAAMNAIASHLEPGSIQSVAMLVSPTTVPTRQPESAEAAERQRAKEPLWMSALAGAGVLPRPGHVAANGVKIGLSTVSIQGLSYQAAQYLSKLAAAESFAVYGPSWSNGHDAAHGIRVSSNVAGITRTRSLSHPLFEAAFIGAPRFGVRIFDPATTRALSGLLILHDLLNDAAPGSPARVAAPAERAAALHSQQIHGGIYNLPYPLEHAIRVAALIGMGQRPSVLLGRSRRPTLEANA
jgi:hypothetical protein